MIYGYIRVSTDMQTVENQRFEINNFCERNELVIDDWIDHLRIKGSQKKGKKKESLGFRPGLLLRCKKLKVTSLLLFSSFLFV